MSSRVVWEMEGFCVRCYFHGEVRPAQTTETSGSPEERRYCRQCAEHMARREEELRQRRENRVPPEITHHDKEAT